MTITSERPRLDASLAAYRLAPGLRLVDEHPFVELHCPHELGYARRNPHKCVTNLLSEEARTRGVQLGTLVGVALFHDDPEPTVERATRLNDLRRQLGELMDYTLAADSDEHPFLIMNCPYAGGRCPGSKDGECTANLIPASAGAVDLGTVLQLATAHENERYGVPIARLAGLRQVWHQRRQEAVYTRETADGWSAGIAGARAALLGQLIDELDKAVAGA